MPRPTLHLAAETDTSSRCGGFQENSGSCAWSLGGGSRRSSNTVYRFHHASGRCPSPIGGNERGGILIAFLIFMGLAVLGLSLYGVRWAQLWDSQRLRATCRAEMKSSYDEVGEKIESLIEMNSYIQYLRVTEKAAYAVIAGGAVTLCAPCIQIAYQTLQWIKRIRKVMRARQQYLITSANFTLLRTRSKVFAKLQEHSGELGLVQRQIAPRWSMPVRVGVRKADQDRELPKYELVPEFESRQKMELKWQSRYRPASGQENKWKLASTDLPESCGMTLENVGTKEKPRLKARPTQDKYFWRR